MNLSDLTADEKLVLGALIRLMVRADGRFTEEEEQRIQEIGADVGSAEELWRAVSESAQRYTSEAATKTAIPSVTRPEARTMIFDVLFGVATADTIAPGEQAILDSLREAWDIRD
ncbi:MAG: TerB family tellurite resistance protein [Deltaproteobacteria bacterium]|nr:TerB family tellurite resistance protein [Deltaproteobacteria bacterium]